VAGPTKIPSQIKGTLTKDLARQLRSPGSRLRWQGIGEGRAGPRNNHYPTAFAAARPHSFPKTDTRPKTSLQRAIAVHTGHRKTGGFAGGVQPPDDLAVMAEHAGSRDRSRSRERLARQDVQLHRDQRAVRGIENAVRLACDQFVADIAPRIWMFHHLARP